MVGMDMRRAHFGNVGHERCSYLRCGVCPNASLQERYIDIKKRTSVTPNLVINHLLRLIVLLQHRHELHNVRIIGIELVSRSIEA